MCLASAISHAYSKHIEKLRKMNLILEIRNEMNWIRVRKKVVALKGGIETEVAKCIRALKKNFSPQILSQFVCNKKP